MPLDGKNFVLPDIVDDKVRQGLRNTANRVARGWCQDSYEDFHGRVCIIGAMAEVAPGKRLRHEMIRHLSRSLRISGASSLIEWNDTPGRTQEQVVSALRKAAEI